MLIENCKNTQKNIFSSILLLVTNVAICVNSFCKMVLRCLQIHIGVSSAYMATGAVLSCDDLVQGGSLDLNVKASAVPCSS